MATKRRNSRRAHTRVNGNGRPHRRILNCLPSRGTEKDWEIEHAIEAGILSAHAIPTSKDLRTSWWAINDQGDTGSCVGWATADSVVRYLMVKANKLPRTRLMSPRFLWMAAKETDEFRTQPTSFIEEEGTSVKAALDVARRYGAIPDSILPFASGKLFGGDMETFYATAAQFKIASYFNLRRDLQAWRQWLATTGPIVVALDVDATWDNASDTSGNLDVYRPQTTRGGHATAIVGYTPDRFIVRNSWGKSWGDDGFAYASLAYAQSAFTEAYGVTL